VRRGVWWCCLVTDSYCWLVRGLPGGVGAAAVMAQAAAIRASVEEGGEMLLGCLA